MELKAPSFAKINIGLSVLDKRPDGFHNILTVFQRIDLHDDLSFQRIEGETTIASTDESLPAGPDNLIWKAFDRFQKETGVSGGLNVHVVKRIPMGGGLGGGSSNAAETLKAANALWQHPLDEAQLSALALDLGSDVPFFLTEGTALGRGRGEILEPLDWPIDWTCVLVCPGIHVSTAWAYNNAKIDLTKEEKIAKFRPVLRRYSHEMLQTSVVNEFEAVVFPRHPILQEVKHQLKEGGAFYASMSGSGSSMYGLFADERDAEKACAFFQKRQRVSAYLCRPVQR